MFCAPAACGHQRNADADCSPQDPLLIWNYTTVAILAAIGGSLFYIQFRKLDQEEDELNMLPKGKLNADDAGDQVALRSESAVNKETS